MLLTSPLPFRATCKHPLFFTDMKNRLAILNYHQIPEQADTLQPQACHRDIFRKQLQALGRYFNVVAIEDGIRDLREGRLRRNTVVITFDDGYRNNHEVAYEELTRAGLPATFFIATAYLDGGRMWNDTLIEAVRRSPARSLDLAKFGLPPVSLASDSDRLAAIQTLIPAFKYMDSAQREAAVNRFADMAGARLPEDMMMTSAQVKALYDGGMTIGAHTSSHPILRRLSPEDARRDIASGCDYLHTLLGVAPRFFAYPNGKPGQDYDKRHVEMLSELNFEAAFSTEWGFADATMNRFELPRVGFGVYTGWRFSLRLLRSYFEAPARFAA